MVLASPPRPALARDDLRKKVLARLAERHDPAKVRHKPLSLLRPELRRLTEQFVEQEAGALGLDVRDALVEEILAEVPGIGPLEELFRDETVMEFMVLSPTQVLRRSPEGWLPTNVQFRDMDQIRRTIKKLFETSEPIGDVPTTSDGAADALLANGFRMLAVLPPRAVEVSSMAVFRRPLPGAAMPTPVPVSGTVRLPERLPVGSGVTATSLTSRMPDPWERLRQRVTERFIERLAANGVYDISAIPANELRRVLSTYVTEFNETDKLHLDGAAQDRLTLEILTGMHR